jgi:hypothetical protein
MTIDDFNNPRRRRPDPRLFQPRLRLVGCDNDTAEIYGADPAPPPEPAAVAAVPVGELVSPRPTFDAAVPAELPTRNEDPAAGFILTVAISCLIVGVVVGMAAYVLWMRPAIH